MGLVGVDLVAALAGVEWRPGGLGVAASTSVGADTVSFSSSFGLCSGDLTEENREDDRIKEVGVELTAILVGERDLATSEVTEVVEAKQEECFQ